MTIESMKGSSNVDVGALEWSISLIMRDGEYVAADGVTVYRFNYRGGEVDLFLFHTMHRMNMGLYMCEDVRDAHLLAQSARPECLLRKRWRCLVEA